MNTQANETVRYLTAENAAFAMSEGGILTLSLREGERYARVAVLRSFPITAPFEYLSVRDPEAGNAELGMIRAIEELDEGSERAVREELSLRYFMPRIERILYWRHRFGVFVRAETDVGECRFRMPWDASAVRQLEDGRVILTDVDGNGYEIPNPRALDKASYRKLSVFL